MVWVLTVDRKTQCGAVHYVFVRNHSSTRCERLQIPSHVLTRKAGVGPSSATLIQVKNSAEVQPSLAFYFESAL